MKNLKTVLGQEREYEKTYQERYHQARVEVEALDQFRMYIDREDVKSQSWEDDNETTTCVWHSQTKFL